MQTITITDNNTPYVIYATLEAKFGEENDINGDVGVTDVKGKAEFKKASVLDPYHVYAKNINVHMPAFVNNKHFVQATGGPNPPNVAYAGGGLSGSHTQSVGGTVPAGNFKNLTIKKGITAIIAGNNYGKIIIEENAQVTFSSDIINIEELQIKKGKSPGTTNVYFVQCTGVRVKDKVDIEEHSRMNEGGPKVIFYMNDNKKDDEKFTAKSENVRITVNVLMPKGKLKVSGSNGNCIMTGWFVVEKLDSDGKFVTWNKYECTPPPATFVKSVKTVEATLQPVLAPLKAEENEKQFEVSAYPNPSNVSFNIVVKSRSLQPVTVRLVDMSGTVLSVIRNTTKGSVINMGNELKGGTYMAEVLQGTSKQIIKLVKLN